jgi:hypothetical protein
MGIWEGLSEAILPHREKMKQDAAFHMAALHNKLHAIESAVHDLGRGDIGDKWQRFQIKKKFASGEDEEIGTCPMNEIWLIQAISSDGVQEKSPAFIIEANELLIESVIKEGLGFEGISGNQVVMPGEELSITARAEGNINCVITLIRREYPVAKKLRDMGKGTEFYSPKAIHDVQRDEIMSRLDQYGAREHALAPTEGRGEPREGHSEGSLIPPFS